MGRVKQGCDKHLAHIQQQPYTNTYALDVCECVTTRNLCKAEVGHVGEVVCRFKRSRYKYKISHPYKNCNSICTTDGLSGALQDTSSSHLALYSYFAPTISLALNGNLLQYLVGSLLWHITASTAISIFATFYYFIANTKGASAILHVTTSTSSFPTSSTTLPLSSALNTSLTAPTTTNISAFKGTTSSSNSSHSSSHVAFYNHNSTVSSNFFNIFVDSNYSSNSTEIAASNSPTPLPPNKYEFPAYSFDNKNNNDNYNDNKSNYNLSSIITLSYNNLTAFNETFDEISDEVASEYIFDRTDVRIIFITLYTMVFCCCFLGNLLVILVVTLSRRLRSITNFFLANLALADFCVGLFCVMQNLSIYLIDSWVFGEFLCRMYQFVHSLSYTASIFILVVICTERYFAIVHPITSKQILTAPRLRMVILTVWITSALYSTPKFVFSKTIKNVHTESGREEEICVLDRKMFSSKVLDMINFGLLYVIPLLVMTVLYSKIAVALWRSSRGLQHHLAQQENSMGMHNSMYHRHNSQLHHHHHHHHHQLHSHHQELSLQLSHQQQQQQGTIPLGASITVNSPNVSGSTLTRKQSCKYDAKRGVNITESQVSLDADRPVVSTCRKTSFYNHLSNQKQTQPPASTNHLRSHAQHHNLHGSQRVSHISHSSNNVLRARRGVVRMLIIFVLAFALCNLPYHARKMWQYWSRSYRGDSNFNALLTPLTFLVTYFNSGINPLLYAFLSRNFRKGMKELLLCSWRKSKTKSSTNSSMHHKRLALQTNSLPTDVTHIGNEQL